MLTIIILYAILVVFFIFVIALYGTARIARKSAAPFFPSPKSVMRRAMQEVALKPGEIFYDLGAGTGTSIILAAREFGARAIGSEINLLPYVIAQLKIVLTLSRAHMKFENLFTQNISDAAVVFCFLTERTMKKLEPKLKAELRPGTRLVCYTFPPPTLVPEKTIVIHGEWKLFLYRM